MGEFLGVMGELQLTRVLTSDGWQVVVSFYYSTVDTIPSIRLYARGCHGIGSPPTGDSNVIFLVDLIIKAAAWNV